ncbi:MAG: response regulator transcription factor [Gammaproteobacteria bacterium]|jgi:two-component system, NarL family, invasion response regulator UvrY|nr:response regulator transcription factor [Gammaproteobacteria bacterium]MBU0773047.1 response regulator transcription factor [Gammaproteobacteria bacterium]MBU0854857.1 response regulator transcription factor [Gammaproteobacteria bacterium]MBU1845255.1 response regulator transcription factor [Gammaproteobacteria bacterium]
MQKKRVLLADDHQIVRNGLRLMINSEPDLEVVAEAATSAETLTLLRQQEFDVLLLDISMPDRDGMDTLRLLRTHLAELPVLIISAYAEEQYALNMLRAGANGYIRKDADVDDILGAIRTVLRGRRYVSDTVADLLTQRLNGDNDAPAHQQLSEREFQVLHKLATGKSVTEIAEELFISVKSVSTYRSRLLTKLNLKSNAELTYYALKNGLIE